MPPSERAPLLLASIHDVSPKFEGPVDRLFDQLAAHVGPRIAMLVVPDHWGTAPLAQAAAFAARLRAWSDMGVEMFVHGWFHRDDSAPMGGMAGVKARHMTAGEGEFLGLDHATALRRMIDGKALVEDIIGRPAAGFIAPAWLYGDGARAGLAEADFALAEDHFRVWRPGDGRIVARGPVITWASRSRMRTASSLAFATLARHALRPLPVVRVAVHPGDVRVPAIVASMDATLTRLMRGRRRAGRYADLSRQA